MHLHKIHGGLSKIDFWRRREVWPAIVLAWAASIALTVFAQTPGWWTDRAVLAPGANTNDFAFANQGQIKWLATQAAAEFDDKLQGLGGAGTNISALLAAFSTTNNYLLVNVGQIKATGKPFYDRLAELSGSTPYLSNAVPLTMTGIYPWTSGTNDDADFAAANIGQAKYTFSMNFDRDGSGLPDWWEIKYFGKLGINPSAYPNTGLHSYLWFYQNGGNPTNFPAPIVLTITAPPDGSVLGGY